VGLRGAGARPKASAPPEPISHPWDAPGLSRAAKIICFLETLPCSQGALAGTTLKLQPWQKRFIQKVYKTDKEGQRLVRTAVLSVARKNGKSQLAAALCLCALSGPESEERGECYSVACTRFQAGRIFNEMVAIIQRVPWLDQRINIVRFRKELEDTVNGSTFAVLAAEVGPVHGLSPSFVCYDELAQVSSRALFDALSTALGARKDPLMVVISTQSASDLAPMSQLVDYGLRVNRREVEDPHFHLTLFTAPPEDDPWSIATWRKANPALGSFRSLEDVKRLAKQAQRVPSSRASFENLILNRRVDATAQFITADVWALGDAPVNVERLRGRPCFGGLDLSASRDLTAIVLVFFAEDGSYDILCFFWLPDADLRDRGEVDRVPYALWRDEGHLLTVPGKTIDPEVIARKLAELHATYDIKAVGFDRWKVADLQRELGKLGSEVPLVEVGQGYKDQAHCVDTLERLAVEGKLRHGGQPVLKWCVGNARATSDPADNRKLVKQRETDRIDGAVALGMALSVATRHQPEEAWEPLLMVV
jgi:phage terminase large subunit-like protein